MIIGAGFAGLIAAHIFPDMSVKEAGPEPSEGHKALLRFRSDIVSQVTHIPFRRVTVRKGIWVDDVFQPCDIRVANAYSTKVIGKVVDRSIWNLEPAERFIAPENFYERLIDQVGARIFWNSPHKFTDSFPVVSTAPMNIVLSAAGIKNDLEFKRSEITVKRYRVPNCDTFQTIYYPTPNHNMYRASITGNMMIAEFIGEPYGDWGEDLERSFWIDDAETIEQVRQQYGKIAPVDERKRRVLTSILTREHNIWSLGRFATWRNILLDDVVDDAYKIKRLMDSSEYERSIAAI